MAASVATPPAPSGGLLHMGAAAAARCPVAAEKGYALNFFITSQSTGCMMPRANYKRQGVYTAVGAPAWRCDHPSTSSSHYPPSHMTKDPRQALPGNLFATPFELRGGPGDAALASLHHLQMVAWVPACTCCLPDVPACLHVWMCVLGGRGFQEGKPQLQQHRLWRKLSLLLLSQLAQTEISAWGLPNGPRLA